MIEFTVLGKAVTKGSTTSFAAKRKDGSLVLRDNGNPAIVTRNASGVRGRHWESAVASCALEARERAGGRIARSEPVGVEVIFYQPRNKGDYGTGRNAHLLKSSAPTHPAVRPDVDKYLRAVLDALSGVCYADDGQVTTVRAEKRFGDPARAEIRVWIVSALPENGQLDLELDPPIGGGEPVSTTDPAPPPDQPVTPDQPGEPGPGYDEPAPGQPEPDPGAEPGQPEPEPEPVTPEP